MASGGRPTTQQPASGMAETKFTIRSCRRTASTSMLFVPRDMEERSFQWRFGCMVEDSFRVRQWTKGMIAASSEILLYAKAHRYNLSFIVQQSVEIGKPMIGISINYRISAWGFLLGKEVQESGQTNLGLRDQRLAMHWVQENIEAFGGMYLPIVRHVVLMVLR